MSENTNMPKSTMGRIYDKHARIEGQKVRRFFDERACTEENSINAVMLQPAGSTLAIDRDEYERRHRLPRATGNSNIIDFGCGAGRLAGFYGEGGNHYLGLDFSPKLIARARQAFPEQENIQFQVTEIPMLDMESMKAKSPFDILIVTGLLIYLNDDAVLQTLRLMSRLAADSAQIYLRESVSDMDVRLTLKEFYSEELKDEYNAIYRTAEELMAMMDETLIATGFRYDVCGEYAFPETLRNRAETAQKYFRLSRQ